MLRYVSSVPGRPSPQATAAQIATKRTARESRRARRAHESRQTIIGLCPPPQVVGSTPLEAVLGLRVAPRRQGPARAQEAGHAQCAAKGRAPPYDRQLDAGFSQIDAQGRAGVGVERELPVARKDHEADAGAGGDDLIVGLQIELQFNEVPRARAACRCVARRSLRHPRWPGRPSLW